MRGLEDNPQITQITRIREKETGIKRDLGIEGRRAEIPGDDWMNRMDSCGILDDWDDKNGMIRMVDNGISRFFC